MSMEAWETGTINKIIAKINLLELKKILFIRFPINKISKNLSESKKLIYS